MPSTICRNKAQPWIYGHNGCYTIWCYKINIPHYRFSLKEYQTTKPYDFKTPRSFHHCDCKNKLRWFFNYFRNSRTVYDFLSKPDEAKNNFAWLVIDFGSTAWPSWLRYDSTRTMNIPNWRTRPNKIGSVLFSANGVTLNFLVIKSSCLLFLFPNIYKRIN